jgi:hypothetical protein
MAISLMINLTILVTVLTKKIKGHTVKQSGEDGPHKTPIKQPEIKRLINNIYDSIA